MSRLVNPQEEAQAVLDELWKENQIPFRLTVWQFIEGVGEYTIRFYDARLPRVHVPLTAGKSFKEMVRDAVLSGVEGTRGPLHQSTERGSN